MRFKPTRAEAICIGIGLVLGLLIYLLTSLPFPTKREPVTVVLPYDEKRTHLVVKSDSADKVVTIVQQQTTQSLNRYEKARIHYDTLTLELP